MIPLEIGKIKYMDIKIHLKQQTT